MGKYTPPAVTWADVLGALPALPMPLAMLVSLRPTKGSVGRAYVAVELVYYGVRGDQTAYKRWGRDVRSGNTAEVMKALLLAAQEAYLFCEGKDPVELTRFIEWQLDKPKTH